MRYLGDERLRQNFAHRYVDQVEHMNLIFSDEHYSGINESSHGWEWCKTGKHPNPRGVINFQAKIHVWGAIGVGVKRLVVLPRNVTQNSERYIDTCIKPNLDVLQGRILMQDGARCHTSAYTMSELNRLNVTVLEGWPARSPDLNPIEQLWSYLNGCVEDLHPTDVDQVDAAVRLAWDRIPQLFIDRLVLTFADKLERCIALRGRTLP
jgi:hypothetical protein